MKETLTNLITVDIEDPDTRRRAQLLNFLLIGVSVVALIALLILIITDVFGLATNSIILYLGSIFVLLGNSFIFILNRRGQVDFASSILLILLTAIFTFADTPQNVVQGRTMFMFVIPVLMASFLLRPSASFIMALAISIIHVIVAYVNDVPGYSPIGLVAFLVIALIAWLASSNLENALKGLRDINRQLDQRVIERTKELAEANLQLEKQTQELAQANIRLTELDAMKSKFVSDVSHELRTPISNLRIYLEMLEGAKPEKRERYRLVLQEETRRLESLVADILDLSRMEIDVAQSAFSRLDLNETVRKVVDANRLGAEVKGLELSFDGFIDLPKIWADEKQLSQAINNLVSNAINYTSQGSVRVYTSYDIGKDLVNLMVQDTGFGIEARDLPHLFERFYRGKRAGQSTIPGTGLGLAITKEIITRHQGQIEVQTDPGEGSVFKVLLPASRKP